MRPPEDRRLRIVLPVRGVDHQVVRPSRPRFRGTFHQVVVVGRDDEEGFGALGQVGVNRARLVVPVEDLPEPSAEEHTGSRPVVSSKYEATFTRDPRVHCHPWREVKPLRRARTMRDSSQPSGRNFGSFSRYVAPCGRVPKFTPAPRSGTTWPCLQQVGRSLHKEARPSATPANDDLVPPETDVDL